MAKPNRYSNVWIFGGFAVALLPLCIWELTRGHQVASSIVILAFALLCFPLGVYSLLVRLVWTDRWIAVQVGPFRRQVSLTTLVHIGYRASGRTGVYIVEDRDGKRVRIDATLFLSGDEWKPVLLAAAENSGASVDPKARTSLAASDGSGSGFLP